MVKNIQVFLPDIRFDPKPMAADVEEDEETKFVAIIGGDIGRGEDEEKPEATFCCSATVSMVRIP